MFLSFIVPVYNTEPYLEDCLDSLLMQDISVDDYEIICINDGSTDESYNVLRKFENENTNVVIINQKNQGVCSARNAGLDAARGDYIWFIDSDDCIRKNVLSGIRSEIYKGNYDRMIIGNYRFKDGTNPFKDIDSKPKNTIWYDSSVWRNVFRRLFLNKNGLMFAYPELTYGEDALFMYEVKYFSPNTIEFDEPIYAYRDRKGSASYSDPKEGNTRQLHSTIREAEIMKEYYEAGRTDSITVDRFMSFLFGALCHISNMDTTERKKYVEIMKRKGLYPYKKPKNCSIKRSYQVNRGGDIIERLYDKIYTNISSRRGYFAMRCWNTIFELKNRVTK